MSKYDLFFYGTVCHVCKIKEQVKRCSACKMIAYCSANHQQEHWRSHKYICKCIQVFLLNETAKKFQHKKQEAWTELMTLVELKLGRELLSVERQMFWFARRCEVCYEFEQDKLQDCEGCASVSYCADKNCRAVDSLHATYCFQLNLGFQLDKYLMQNSYPSFLLPPVQDKVQLPSNIDTFISEIISKTDYINMNLTKSLAVPLFSELLSCPLTLVYSVEMLGIKEKQKLIVHVVGAANAECAFIAHWETVIHCLPQLKDLVIVFIGPECWDQQTKLHLCINCTEKRRTLKIEMYAQLYHEYVNSSDYIRPHLVVVFNCGLHETKDSHNDTWALSIPLLLKGGNPLVLTSYTFEEALQDIQRLEPNLEKIINCKKNPFCSLRPYRDTERIGNKVFYLNAVLSIVRRL